MPAWSFLYHSFVPEVGLTKIAGEFSQDRNTKKAVTPTSEVTAFLYFGGGAGNIKTSNSKVFLCLETNRRHIKSGLPPSKANLQPSCPCCTCSLHLAPRKQRTRMLWRMETSWQISLIPRIHLTLKLFEASSHFFNPQSGEAIPAPPHDPERPLSHFHT